MSTAKEIRILKHNSVYRIGDLVFCRGIRWLDDRKAILSNPIYKGSILFKYLNTINIFDRNFINWNSLLNIVKEYNAPKDEDLYIYIRCGDIATDNEFHKDCFIFNQNKLLDLVSLNNGYKSISIIAAMHYGSNDKNNKYFFTEENYSTNILLLNNLFESLSQKFNFKINILKSDFDDINFIDDQFLKLIHCKNAIIDSGGFGELASILRSKLP